MNRTKEQMMVREFHAAAGLTAQEAMEMRKAGVALKHQMNSLFPQSDQLPNVSDHWCLTRDGDPYGYALSRRHYSARNYREQRQRLFVGPGRKLVLLSKDGNALFVWRKFKDDIQPPQSGYNCAIFRNEGNHLSSELIQEVIATVSTPSGVDN